MGTLMLMLKKQGGLILLIFVFSVIVVWLPFSTFVIIEGTVPLSLSSDSVGAWFGVGAETFWGQCHFHHPWKLGAVHHHHPWKLGVVMVLSLSFEGIAWPPALLLLSCR